MKLADAEKLVLDLMHFHGLLDPDVEIISQVLPGGYIKGTVVRSGWTFAWNKRRCQFGICRYKQCRIELSCVLVELNEEQQVRDTILHEIAHAMAGPKTGHGKAWKLIAQAIGAVPKRCGTGVLPPPKYTAVCPNCKHVHRRFRRKPKKLTACGYCCEKLGNGRFDWRFVLNFSVAEEKNNGS